jgi:hypothetical protein
MLRYQFLSSDGRDIYVLYISDLTVEPEHFPCPEVELSMTLVVHT